MFLQLVVSGVATGMLYALVALSMTVGYRATTVVNFGHGDMVMAGAYAVFVFVGSGLPFAPALLLGLVVLFLFGLGTQRVLMRPIIAGPHLSLAMMALAIGYAVRGGARLEWGSEVTTLQRPYAQDAWMVGPVVFTTDDLVIATFVILLLLVLFLVFNVTPVGRLIRAVFQSQRGAALVGIDVHAFHGVMWGAGAALGAAGGVLLALIVPLSPDMGVWTLLRGFAAMTLGGFGSLHGAVIGGLILGVMEKLLGFYLSTVFIDITAYLITILVLLIRPSGLFGRQAAVRV
ncbi:MAG: branched-chain amino acid ABC transporter permease [Alphaproteobacteria bacterium]|nr:branched-chain amino acid ABC transporter permease [Alphaproteobacteria bacterium]